MGLYKQYRKNLPDFIRNRRRRRSLHFYADGMGVRNKNLSHFDEPGFAAAWNFAREGNKEGWNDNPPDLRWRASVCCWAANNALSLEGDFVECGVHTGLLSMTICHKLNFQDLDRRFYLYDTFEGIPEAKLSGEEKDFAAKMNSIYFDVWEIAQRNFSDFPNAKLVRGFLPDSLDENCPDKIAYLSIDLNSATFEHQTISRLWDRIVPGAAIVIDDYGFAGHEKQFEMWNAWAESHGTSVLYIPTGQGVIVKPPHAV